MTGTLYQTALSLRAVFAVFTEGGVLYILRHKQQKREQTCQAIKENSGVRIQALRQFLCSCYCVQECNSPRISFGSNKKPVKEDKLYKQAGQCFLVLLSSPRGEVLSAHHQTLADPLVP